MTNITSNRSSNKLLGNAALDKNISNIIELAKLTRTTNGFFRKSKLLLSVEPGPALYIAHNWREITKAFMFSTIAGLGVMAGHAMHAPLPSINLLRTIQTVHSVIGDDLNNTIPEFSKAAPPGIKGIHYLWWHSSVLEPIFKKWKNNEAQRYLYTSLATKALTQKMDEFAQSFIGAAVQLRVVEAIALDIAVAFHCIFSRVMVNNEKVFTNKNDLLWMTSHIKAEVNHNKQVSDADTGMTKLADTIYSQCDMLNKTKSYVDLWREALADFERAITNQMSNV